MGLGFGAGVEGECGLAYVMEAAVISFGMGVDRFGFIGHGSWYLLIPKGNYGGTIALYATE